MLPPSRLSSTVTDDVAGKLLDQVIAAGVPAKRVAPAAGLVTVSVGIDEREAGAGTGDGHRTAGRDANARVGGAGSRDGSG